MITMITILFLKSYNQFSIWRTKGEKRMPQHDMIAGFQCIPGEGSVPFFLMLQKFSAKTVFGKKRGRVRSCTTVCNAFSASSARARVQKCTKMQAGRSFAVAETSQQLIAVVHWQSMEEQLRCFFNPPPLTLSSRQCLGQRNQENLRGLKTWQKAEGIGKSILHAQEISRILFLHYECNVKVLLYI